MTKLLPLFAIAALAVGCKKDKGLPPASATGSGSAATDHAGAGPAPTAGSAAAPVSPPPTPTPTATPGDHAAASPGALPKECDDYKAAIQRLASCPKLAPDAKDSLVQAYEAASASWARLPEDSRKNLVGTCKAGVDSVTAAAKTQCGW